MTESYQLEVQKNEQDELFIELPSEVMENLGWKTGDDVKWEETEDVGLRVKKARMETIEREFVDAEWCTYMQMSPEINERLKELV